MLTFGFDLSCIMLLIEAETDEEPICWPEMRAAGASRLFFLDSYRSREP